MNSQAQMADNATTSCAQRDESFNSEERKGKARPSYSYFIREVVAG